MATAFTSIKDKSLFVGDSTVNAFTFVVPTPQPTTMYWCVPYKNTIVNDDATGTVLSGAVAGKMIQCLSDPCLQFSIVSSTLEDTWTFKIKSVFPGEMEFLSTQSSITITCSNLYTVTESPVNAP